VSVAVTAQKRNLLPTELADEDRSAGLAERRIKIVTLCARHLPGERVAQSRAAYYSDQFFCHSSLLRIVSVASIVIVRSAFTITLSAVKELEMRNRKSSLGLWLLVLVLVLVFRIAPHSPKRPTHCDWLFVYYMSYDNDLSSYGRGILSDLRKGVVNSKIAVTVQADFADSGGMKRVALFHENGKPQMKEVILRSEDSADDVQFQRYLEWVHKNWNAENYCVVFLNHGGTLDHMCQDLKPFKDSGRNRQFTSGKWLRASKAAGVLKSFNRKVGNKVRLLFLQQCGRAAIQNLYTFVDSAAYIMASPVIVDAPNTYYAKTLASVAQDPNVTIETLAETIMREDEHYTVYTLINNEQLRKLPKKLAPVLDSFEAASVFNRPGSCSPVFEFAGEKFYDLKSHFQALSAANNNVASGELGDFFSWCENELIVSKSVRESEPAKPSCCGLSIYVPSSEDPNTCYDSLPFYKQANRDAVITLMPK
jgi:hypothetical protein